MDDSLLRFNKQAKFVFIDLETYNLCLSFQHNRPWQIGMIEVQGSTILRKYENLIKWKTNLIISKRAAEITHFDPAKLEKLGVTPEEVFPEMQNWLDNADYIVGHNILGFDIYLIKDWYLMNGKNPEPLFSKVIDTNVLAKAIKLSLPSPTTTQNLLEYQYPIFHYRQKGLKTRLEILGRELSIEHDYEHLHDALVDLELNVKVWLHQKHTLVI